eukprot:9919516-Alexandrium_andersonii.AAC.1
MLPCDVNLQLRTKIEFGAMIDALADALGRHLMLASGDGPRLGEAITWSLDDAGFEKVTLKDIDRCFD